MLRNIIIAKTRQIILAYIAFPHHCSGSLYGLSRSDGCFSYIEVVEHPLALLTTIMALMYTCAVGPAVLTCSLFEEFPSWTATSVQPVHYYKTKTVIHDCRKQ